MSKYRLANREVELLALALSGRNVVRSHLRKTHAKFNVHSRSELVDRVEEELGIGL